MVSYPEQLWAKILQNKYGSPLENKTQNQGISHIWRGILYGDDAFKQLVDNEEVNLRDSTTAVTVGEVYKKSDSEDIIGGFGQQWRNIWKYKGQMRACVLLWFFKHDQLPTADFPTRDIVLSPQYDCNVRRRKYAYSQGLLLCTRSLEEPSKCTEIEHIYQRPLPLKLD